MNLPKPTVAVISQFEGLKDQLLMGGADLSTEVRGFKSVEDFKVNCGTDRYVGIVIDLKTIMASANADKAFLYELEASFPLLRVIHHDPKEKEMTGVVEGVSFEGENLLDRFVHGRCKDFAPRGIRRVLRRALYLNVILQSSEHELLWTNTTDVSIQGAFIISPLLYQIGGLVDLVPHDLEDNGVIKAQVRWLQRWGESTRRLPGIGVHFTNISPSQVAEIAKRTGFNGLE